MARDLLCTDPTARHRPLCLPPLVKGVFHQISLLRQVHASAHCCFAQCRIFRCCAPQCSKAAAHRQAPTDKLPPLPSTASVQPRHRAIPSRACTAWLPLRGISPGHPQEDKLLASHHHRPMATPCSAIERVRAPPPPYRANTGSAEPPLLAFPILPSCERL
jgi:hypothetical protein